ncbi:MAG: hypothetical protein K9M98_15885, partial [Cephaloticoccus sp.]|nr:hypothetical protein [Cephaloticoccus sp.]
MKSRFFFLSTLGLLLWAGPVAAKPGQPAAGFSGEWTLLPFKSAQIDLFNNLALKIELQPEGVTLAQIWGQGGYKMTDQMTLKTDGLVNRVPVTNRVWNTQPFMGVSMKVGVDQQVTAQ